MDNKNEIQPFKSELGKEEKVKLLSSLKSKFEKGIQYYTPIFKDMKLLDAIDKGDLWKALKAKFPNYQILPDTNFVSYVKQNILASLYTVAKSAQILPTNKEDAEIITQVNTVIENLWDTINVPNFQYRAGERAALLNVGYTQVGWSENTVSNGEKVKENVVLNDIDPMKFMRDPFSSDLKTAGWCCHFDQFDKSYFISKPEYREEFAKLLEENPDNSSELAYPDKNDTRPASSSDDTYTLVIFWVKEIVKRSNKEVTIISEYHTIDAKHLLYYKRDIKPSRFPIVPLYCNLPTDSLVGTSEPRRIRANAVAFNLMDSMTFTAEYKNQHPPKFISSSSGLNVGSFAKYGDGADRAFIVHNDASKAVHYHEFPAISQTLPKAMDRMQENIQTITGVDDRYTGRDTGSIITTGGTEEMLNRVTLIDAPKVLNYENYTKDLTELILLNLCEFSPKREYLVKKPTHTGQPKWETVEVDFTELFKGKEDKSTLFRYSINISSELPKNKQRLAAFANMVMEHQSQYQQDGAGPVELMTEEEWLMFQDVPNKEYMLERMGFQRAFGQLEETSATLQEFAQLIEQGVNPEEATALTANSMSEMKYGQPLPGMENLEQGAMAPAGAPPMNLNEEPLPPQI